MTAHVHVDIGHYLLRHRARPPLRAPPPRSSGGNDFENWDEFYPDMQETADRVQPYLRGVYGDVHVHLKELSSD